ncbi:MAG: zinc ABC transporter solute-binding protein [Synechococcales cyanobacterium RM1_1_8]|nr:zinc ABC transporter solute-binding protein [Synechococcales cyanobacterium RM1_1_8]
MSLSPQAVRHLWAYSRAHFRSQRGASPIQQRRFGLHSFCKATAALVLTLALAPMLGSCTNRGTGAASTSPNDPENRPSVVATSTIIADLTQEIAGDEIVLTSILRPGDDPHVYEPVPADIKAVERADLVLYNGFNLEPALIRLMAAVGQDAPQIAVGEAADALEMDKAGQKQPDPHVWGDVRNAIAMVNAIRDALIEISPEDETLFISNAQTLNAQLNDLDTWVYRQIETIPKEKRLLVTTHDAFQYYAQAYELEMLGTLIGISTEEQPSAQTIQALVSEIKARQVPAIFAETTINPQLIQTVAAEAGVKLSPQALYSDSIGAVGSPGESYIKMIEANTKAIVEALGGRYQPFVASAAGAAGAK